MWLQDIKQIVAATEQRFPHHNGPFEYGTRLAEEIGELIEAIYKAWQDEESAVQPHLVRELADVLRVTMGIAKHYGLNTDMREMLREYCTSSAPTTAFECLARVGTASYGLANAINHAEGVGVKTHKHDIESQANLRQGIEQMFQVVADTTELFNLYSQLTDEVTQTLLRYKKRGLIPSLS